MICERCGHDVRRIVLHGPALWCGPCHDSDRTITHAHGIVTDDIPGGQTVENLGHEPMTFYSKHAIRAEADRRGLRFTDKWAGPGDKYLTNWGAAIDPYTLDAARALVSRQGAIATPEPDVTCETFQWSAEVKE